MDFYNVRYGEVVIGLLSGVCVLKIFVFKYIYINEFNFFIFVYRLIGEFYCCV